MPPAAVPAEEIRAASLDVLAALGVSEVEMEASILEIDFLVELAQGGEVEPIDTADPAGGFGAPDLWAATVVPAVARLLAARRAGTPIAGEVERVVAEMIERVGSPRARRERARLVEGLHGVVRERAPISGKEAGR
jgi:hypothetical protein